MNEQDEKSLALEYEQRISTYENLELKAKEILEFVLYDNQVRFHAIEHRVKEFDSFCQKANRIQSDDPFSDIVDVVGLRVICLFRSEIEQVSTVIRKSFDILSEENKFEEVLNTFGYMAVHFIAMIKGEWSVPIYEPIKEIPFEIQITTIAMNAWASISHHLEYKKDIDIPMKFKKDFYALSGLLYIADSQFQRFYQERNKSIKRMTKDESYLDSELNLDSLKAYLYRKFPNRKKGTGYYSSFLKSLIINNVISIREIDACFNRAYSVFLEYEKKVKSPDYYNDVGAIAIIFYLCGKPIPPFLAYPKLNEYRKMVKSD